jgi:diguanylate cyclase (GGDEF)-like protein
MPNTGSNDMHRLPAYYRHLNSWRKNLRANLPWIAFLAVFGGSFPVAWEMNRQIDADLKDLFDQRADYTHHAIQTRLNDYALAMRGVVGMMAANPHVTAETWASYFQPLKLQDTYPGIQTVGYAPVVSATSRSALVAKLQTEGFAQYGIRPEGERVTYVPVAYVSPSNERTLRALGFDMFSESVRRAALEQARDSGEITVTRRVTLVTDNKQEEQPGILMYAPIYKSKAALGSVGERRANLVSYVFGAFRTRDLIASVFAADHSEDIDVAVYDGIEEDEASLLYSNTRGSGAHNAFKGTLRLSAGDRTWTLAVQSTASFAGSADRAMPKLTLGGGFVLAVLVMGVLRAGNNQHKKALELASMGQRLETTIGALQSQTHELNNLRELSDVLQNCKSRSEAFSIIARFVRVTFPGSSGGIFLVDNSRSMVEPALVWGESGDRAPDPFHPDECWGLRRSKPNLVEREDALTQCSHLATGSTCHMCIPMSNQGESVGVFHLLPPPGQGAEWFKCHESLVSMLCEQVGVALGGLKLRDHLRQQSIRDSLTGLFNRRYLEETLPREERRAARESAPIGIIVMDVDHFKRLNDTYGHDTGDHVLRQVGVILRMALRDSDIPCRYGGEEFVLALPGAGLEVTQRRAEEIRRALEKMSVTAPRGAVIGVTASLGVALYPDNAPNWAEVITAADRAMYRAKSGGRNKVETEPARKLDNHSAPAPARGAAVSESSTGSHG